MDAAHPLGISVGQIVVDGDDMHAFAFEGIEVSGKGGHEGLTFTGTHLCDTALMQDDTADELYTVVLHTENTFAGFTDGGEGFGEQIVEGFAVGEAFSELSGLVAEFFVGHVLHGRSQSFDFIYDRIDTLQLALAVRSKYFFG